MATALNQHSINKRASEYVVRLYSGELTAKEESEILEWCDAKGAHQAAFNDALYLWETSAQIAPHVGWRQKLEKRFYRMRYLAASIVVASFCFLLITHHNAPDQSIDNSELANNYSTAIGEVSNVGLSDGSTITLNTDTRINIKFSEAHRELWLEQGEAFFDIAKDRSRPFLIHTANKTVRVVGTKFNIKLSQAGFDIAVEEGIVAIEEKAGANTDKPAKNDTQVLLEAGAVASFNDTSALIAKQSVDSVVKAQSWRTGYLRFDEERLEKVITSFNRYRSKKIVISQEIADLRISGVFKLSDGDAILTALEATLPVEIKKENEKVKLVKK
jgi:transmembrane sensor